MNGANAEFDRAAVILSSLAVILLAGFLLTRLTKFAKLPNVTGYIIAGILIGPNALGLISRETVEGMGFVIDIALAFIAFGVGRYFKAETFRHTKSGVLVITLAESLLTGVVVALSTRLVFGLSWEFCLLLGASATATAPASTMTTIRQYGARGEFVNTLLQVVALDDAVCLAVFSLAVAAVNAGRIKGISPSDLLKPMGYNIAALAAGFVGGAMLSRMMTPKRSEDNRLILTIAMLLGIAGICAAFDVSPLLACIVFGGVYVNKTKDNRLYTQLEQFMPPVLTLFFVVSGMSLNLKSLKSMGAVGIFYFFIRIIGKYAGAYIGCAAAKTSVSMRRYLGLALVPQAGVAIGLAFLAKRMLSEPAGDMFLTIIMSSSVLYELVGPPSAKFALVRAGSME